MHCIIYKTVNANYLAADVTDNINMEIGIYGFMGKPTGAPEVTTQ